LTICLPETGSPGGPGGAPHQALRPAAR